MNDVLKSTIENFNTKPRILKPGVGNPPSAIGNLVSGIRPLESGIGTLEPAPTRTPIVLAPLHDRRTPAS